MLERWLLIILLSGVAACAHKPVPQTDTVDPKWVEQIAAEHNHEVLLCYQNSLNAKAKAKANSKSQLQGDLVLSNDAAADGSVTKVVVKQGLDKKFDACVTDRAKTWKYPWIKTETAEIEDSFHLALDAAGQPMAEFKSPKSEPLRLAIRGHLVEVRQCYENRLMTRSNLSGKLIVDWEIDDTGSVKSTHIAQALDSELDKCVVDKLKTWKFRVPHDGVVTQVSYPFVFSAK